MGHVLLLKQFGDLGEWDFAAHPVWVQCHIIDYDQPWYEETDEETFRPWDGELPVDPQDGMFLIRAEFTLADGTNLSGFLTPQVKGEPVDLGIIQPHMFLPSGVGVGFWRGLVGLSDEDRKEFYLPLGKSADDVFPISFAAKKGLALGIVSGLIPGCWPVPWKIGRAERARGLRSARRARGVICG